MTTEHQIIDVIKSAGGTKPRIGHLDELGVCYVRFVDRDGRRNTRYGMTPADLLKRCEAFLKTLNGKVK